MERMNWMIGIFVRDVIKKNVEVEQKSRTKIAIQPTMVVAKELPSTICAGSRPYANIIRSHL
jgi:hypothetical protein